MAVTHTYTPEEHFPGSREFVNNLDGRKKCMRYNNIFKNFEKFELKQNIQN